MQEKKVTEAESNPVPSMRLPENDAFYILFVMLIGLKVSLQKLIQVKF